MVESEMSDIIEWKLLFFKTWEWSFVMPLYVYNSQQKKFIYKSRCYRNFLCFISIIVIFFLIFVSNVEMEISIDTIVYRADVVIFNFHIILTILKIYSSSKNIVGLLESISSIRERLEISEILLPEMVDRNVCYSFFIYSFMYTGMLIVSLCTTVREDSLEYLRKAIYVIGSFIIFSFLLFYIFLEFFLKHSIKSLRLTLLDGPEFELKSFVKLLKTIKITGSKLNNLCSSVILSEILSEFSIILFAPYWIDEVFAMGIHTFELLLNWIMNWVWFLCAWYRLTNLILAAVRVENEVSFRNEIYSKDF